MLFKLAMVGRKAIVGTTFSIVLMPTSPYKGGKSKRHFTLSEQASVHLSAIAGEARLSRSEALERLIRATPAFEGSALLANGAWTLAIDHSSPSSES
jgi:hypothetical protein